MLFETLLPKAAVACVVCACAAAYAGRRGQRLLSLFLPAGIVLLAVGLGLRWARLGHGPFFNLYEIQASSLLSMGLIYAIANARMAALRDSAYIVLPVLTLLGVWMWVTPALDSHFLPTYKTPWLWAHLITGKLFLGTLLTAVGIACIAPLRRLLGVFAAAPADVELDERAWGLLRVALLFESLMLVAGSVWAQGAWGRYWAWDPLETSAFLTWVALVAALHARQAFRIGPSAAAGMAVGVFVLAFLTFFGVPFVSQAPHQGAL